MAKFKYVDGPAQSSNQFQYVDGPAPEVEASSQVPMYREQERSKFPSTITPTSEGALSNLPETTSINNATSTESPLYNFDSAPTLQNQMKSIASPQTSSGMLPSMNNITGSRINPISTPNTNAQFRQQERSEYQSNDFNNPNFDFAKYKEVYDRMPQDKKLELFKKGLTPEEVAYKNNPSAYGEMVNQNFNDAGLGGDIFSGVSKGIFSVPESLRGISNSLSGIFGGDKNKFKGDAGIKAFEQARAKEMSNRSFVENIPESTAQVLTEMVPAIMTGGTAGLTYMGTLAGGRNMQQALDEGATPIQAYTHGQVTGIAEAITEKMFGFVPGMQMFEEGLSGLTGNLTKNIGKIAANYGKKAAGEGIEEVIMDPVTQASKGTLYDNNVSFNPLNKETYGDNGLFPLQQMAESGALGVIAGGILGGGNVVNQISQANMARQTIAQNIQRDIYSGYSMPEDTQSYQKAVSLIGKGSNTTIEEYQDYVNTLKQEQKQIESQTNIENAINTALSYRPAILQPMHGANKTYKLKGDVSSQQQPETQINQVNNIEGQSILPEQNEPIKTQNTTYDSILQNQFGERNENKIESEDPNFIDNRTIESVKGRNINAYQYDNPEFKPWYQDYAKFILQNEYVRAGTAKDKYSDTARSIQGEVMKQLKDSIGNYNDIEKGLQAIIEDKGSENIASAKKIELVIDNMLSDGFTMRQGEFVKPSQEYVKLKKQIAERGNQFTGVGNMVEPIEKYPIGTELKDSKGKSYKVTGHDGVNIEIKGNGWTLVKGRDSIDNGYSIVEQEKPKQELIPANNNKLSTISETKTKRVNNIPEGKSYDEYQKMIDDYSDEIINKYGEEELLKAPISDYGKIYQGTELENNPIVKNGRMTYKGDETKLTDTELNHLKDLYERRDQVETNENKQTVDNITKNVDFSKVGKEWVASKSAVEKALYSMIESNSLSNIFGHDTNTSLEKIAEKLYNSLIQSTGAPQELWGEFKYAIEVAQNFKDSVFGKSTLPLLEQINQIIKGMTGTTENAVNVPEQLKIEAPKQEPKPALEEKVDKLDEKLNTIIDTLSGKIEVKKEGVKNDRVDESNGARVERKLPEGTPTNETKQDTNKVSGVERGAVRQDIQGDAEQVRPESATRPETNGDITASVPKKRNSKRISDERSAIVSGTNFRIAEDTSQAEGGKVTRFNNNVTAIKLVKELEETGRSVTIEEQNILAKYVGWGGIKEAFDYKWDYDTKSYVSDNPAWEKQFNELKGLLTKEEYDAANESVQNAHYTSFETIRAMYKIADHLGFKGGRILEPSAGIGNFIGAIPNEMLAKSSFVSVEKDHITGLILKHLYPENKTYISGFEKTNLPDGYFDMAISNVPFGDIRIYDKTYEQFPEVTNQIHNYFFAKSLDKVKDGGLVIFITSTGTMDSSRRSFKQLINTKAELIAAYRMPGDTFKENAGTEVTTDIIVLKKRERGTLNKNPDFYEDKLTDVVDKNNKKQSINEYFVNNPQNVLGELTINKLYGSGVGVKSNGDTMAKLYERISELPKDIISKHKSTIKDLTSEQQLEENKKLKDGSIVVKGNKVFKNTSNGLVEINLNDIPDSKNKGESKLRKLKKLYDIKMAVKNTIDEQTYSKDAVNLEKYQKELNKVYDEFVKEFGYIHDNLGAFKKDPEIYLLTALEVAVKNDETEEDEIISGYTKANIFTQRVNKPYIKATKASNAKEALVIVMYEDGRLDMDRVASLLDKSVSDVANELDGEVFNNPNGSWEVASEYLSGNVKEKLLRAEESASLNKEYEKNVDALKQVQPIDKQFKDIHVRLGAAWIPSDIVKDYIEQLLDTRVDEIGYSPAIGKWNIKLRYSNSIDYQNFRTDLGVEKLIEKVLNNSKIVVEVKTKEGTIINQEATHFARTKAKEIESKFIDYLYADAKLQDELVFNYNSKVNTVVERKFAKSKKKYIGMSELIELRPHQNESVERIIYDNNTLLAHDVGFGKTYIMLTAAIELKRLGIANKPMMVVPNNKLTDFKNDMLALYPMAKILSVTEDDFTPANIKQTFAMIATNDWDCIFLRHANFGKIPVGAEIMEQEIEKELEEYRNTLILAKQTGEKKYTVAQIEKNISNLEVKLEKTRSQESKYDTLTFEEMGVDYLFVDEAHAFKNMPFATSKSNVKGISTSSADKALDMKIKSSYIRGLHGGKKGIVFATGTPVSNALNELYAMFKYLRPDILDSMGTPSFDAWLSVFGSIEGKPEVQTGGTIKFTERFRDFFNLQELFQQFKQFADMKYDAKELGLKLPELKNGKPTIVQLEPDPSYKAYITDVLIPRINSLKKGKKEKGDDTILACGDTARQATVDLRLVDPSAKDFVGSKVNTTVKNVVDIYKRTAKQKGTQLVFIERGQNHKNTGFNLYTDLINKLVKQGIPRSEIVNARTLTGAANWQELFKNMNNGKVRVLIGTYAKMSTGLNVQKRLAAIHEVDTPWKPAEVLQAEGRMMRQGNDFADLGIPVEILRYVVSDPTSYDAVMWQTLETKIKAINKLMKGGDVNSIEAEEDASDVAAREMEIIKAKSMGDERPIRLAELNADIPELEAKRRAFIQEKSRYLTTLRDSPSQISNSKNMVEKIDRVLKEWENREGMDITVKGERFIQKDGQKFEKDEVSPKTKAGAKLQKLASVSIDNVELGKYNGIKLLALNGQVLPSYSDIFNNGYGFDVIDINFYKDFNVIDKLDSHISKRLQDKKEWYENNIATLEKNLKTAKTRSNDDAFPQEEKYKQMTSEQQLLTIEIENNVPINESKTKYRKEQSLEQVENRLEQNINENAPDPILANKEGFIGARRRKPGNVNFVNEEVGNRYEDAKEVKTPLLGKTIARLDQLKKETMRGRFSELERGAKYAELRQKLLQFTKGKDIALYRTLKNLQGVVVKMDKKDYELFNAKIVFTDLLEDAKENKALPFGLNDRTMVQEELDNIEKQIGNNQVIEESISLRNDLWEAMKNKYKDTMKSVGFNVDNRFTKTNYFRHLVIEYVQKDRLLTGTGQKLKTPRGSGFLKMRHGYEGDIVSDYLQAEAEVMAQMMFDIERAKVIKYVEDSEHNIIKPLRKRAKEMNAEMMEDIYNTEATDENGEIMLDDKGRRASDSEKLMKKYASYMAMSFSKLENMQKQDTLWKGENGEFSNISFTGRNLDEGNRVFKYLSELAKVESANGNIEARTILKYHKLREQFVQETLGNKFATWEKIIPQGFNIWQATKGNAMYMTYSIPEQLAQMLVNDGIESVMIDKDALKRIAVEGRPYREMVLPNEVIATLDNLTNENLKGIQSGKIMNAWKVWQLIMPRRLFKYNLRNISGDLDKVFLGNPQALNKIPKATTDLFNALYAQKNMSPEMKEWFERGGLSSFLQVNEMGDINELKMFLNTTNKRSLNFIKGYWKQARLATDFREGILRYASYLSFKEQIKTKGIPNNYGGSIPSEINALTDINDRAYQLSNELLGAYDDISVTGQKLRARYVPFYSFMEANMKTYYRAVKNTMADSDGMATIGRAAVVGGKKLPFMVARNIGRFIIGATFLTTALAVWNYLFFRDEEEDIPENEKKRAHFIYGRDSNGKPLYMTRLGSLTDALEWFGLGTIQNDLKEVLNGKKTIKEQVIEMAKAPVVKVYNSSLPLVKLVLETSYGMTGYPDPFKPRSIRDRGEFLAQSLGLENEYKSIFGKPTRGYLDSLIGFVAYRTDPKETAFYETLDAKKRYKESIEGKKESSGNYTPSDKSNALYNYKLAIRYKDKEAADKYLAEYISLGGDKKGYMQSMQQLNPVYGIEDVKKFEKFLDSEELAKLETAKKFYDELLDGSDFVDGEYAKAYIHLSELRQSTDKKYKKMKDKEIPKDRDTISDYKLINKVDSKIKKLNKKEKTHKKQGKDIESEIESKKTSIYQRAIKKIQD